MARLLDNLLLLTVGLTLRIRLLVYWSLVYGYCALCSGVALLKLGWSILLRPAATFRWTVREIPPACLNDTSLGTHCYVRIKESGLRFHYVAAGERGKPLMLFLHGFPEFWAVPFGMSRDQCSCGFRELPDCRAAMRTGLCLMNVAWLLLLH